MKGYKKINNVSELTISQAIAVLGFYNDKILSKTSDIIFSEFIKHNVYTDSNGGVVIGVADAETFFQKWRNTPEIAIHIGNAFYGLHEEEENKFIANLKNRLI